MAKGFFIDLTRCTACRGCQVACKQWHDLPAEKTKNRGSHQNPADLSAITYKLVRMNEVVDNGELDWLFFPEQCRHCKVPSCQLASDVEGSIIQDEATGAVIFTDKTKEEDFENIRESCPYNIPRQNPETGAIAKCDMCLDRVQNGLLPACVATCPTGTMNFGEWEDMRALAEQRLAEVKAKRPNAVLADADDLTVIYLMERDPAMYHEYAVASRQPLSRQKFLAKAIKPLRHLIT